MLQFDADGILQVQSVQGNLDQEVSDREAADNALDNALDNAKLDKTGGTISGDLEVQGKLTLDADDVADVQFDEPIFFTRWVQPCSANSAGWDNLGYAWKSADGLATLYIPMHAIVGAELVSIDVGVTSAATGALNVYFGFTTADYAASIVTGRVDFGDVMVEVAAGEVRVTNVPVVDPADPDEGPFVLRSHYTSSFGFAQAGLFAAATTGLCGIPGTGQPFSGSSYKHSFLSLKGCPTRYPARRQCTMEP